MILYNILSELVISMDQTGVILLVSKKQIFILTNSKQINISHYNNKWAFILCVTNIPVGLILAFQVIQASKYIGLLPSANTPKYNKAIKKDFTAPRNNHFSTFKTIKEVIAFPYSNCL